MLELGIAIALAGGLLAVVAVLATATWAARRAERRLSETMRTYSAIVSAAVGAADSTRALDGAAGKIAGFFDADACVLALPTGDGRLFCGASFGYPNPDTLFMGESEGACGAVFTSGQPLIAPQVSEETPFLDRIGGIRSVIAVPLRYEGRTLGALEIESRTRHYGEKDLAMLSPLADQLGAVVENIRLRREAAAKAAEEHAKLREADRLKEDFIATVSHELRTPLTSIKGYAQTLLYREDSLGKADRADFLGVIVKQCDRLGVLVETLLLASRLEAGQIGVETVYVMAREALSEAVETADGSDRAMLEVERGLGLVTDPYRFHHIARNLIENACKYSPPESPVLIRARQSQDQIELQVLDQGPGIPQEERENVFDRFRRLARPDQGAVPGTGLGLYIARRFARDLGGDVIVCDAEEPPWTGCRFQVLLPSSVANAPGVEVAS